VTSQPEAAKGRIVVVNADDFGLSRKVNEAILQAFDRGLISSATIMANMPAFEDACQLVRQHHLQRRIGLHLAFTSGKPLTPDVADCPRLCGASGCWRPRRRVIRLNRKETLALEAEIGSQLLACERQGITPTHLDSHHHMHTEWGIARIVVRAAHRHGIGAIRLAFNCGPGRRGASRSHRMLATAYRGAYNTYLRIHGLAKTDYFGDALDTAKILQTTTADVEVMVHPTIDDRGRLIDSEEEALESRIAALRIPAAGMCSYFGL
jgi:chitin disaccharide deacetylase